MKNLPSTFSELPPALDWSIEEYGNQQKLSRNYMIGIGLMASPLIIKYGYTTLSWTQKEPLVKAGRKLLDKKKRKKRSPPKPRNSIPTVMLPAVRGTKVIDFQLLLTASTDSTTAWIEIHIHFSLELQFAFFCTWKKHHKPRMIKKSNNHGTYKFNFVGVSRHFSSSIEL